MGTVANTLTNVQKRGHNSGKGVANSLVQEAEGGAWHARTIQAGLSTQIVVTAEDAQGVYHQVGAIQTLTPTETRPLVRIQEVGTDGVLQIVPNAPYTIELAVTRLVFDFRRLPPAFARGFRHISAQRIPFNIKVYDYNRYAEYDAGLEGPTVTVPVSSSENDLAIVQKSLTTNNNIPDFGSPPINVKEGRCITTVYTNCWLTSYTYTYDQSNYLITESATIWAEAVHDENSPLPLDKQRGDLVEMYSNTVPNSNAMAVAFVGGRVTP